MCQLRTFCSGAGGGGVLQQTPFYPKTGKFILFPSGHFAFGGGGKMDSVLTQDGIKSYFYGNDCFEPKIAIISYLNLLKTVFGKPGQVLSLSGLLYPLRVHVNIISSSQAWLIIISDVNCQYCLKWCELTRNNLCNPAELIGLI